MGKLIEEMQNIEIKTIHIIVRRMYRIRFGRQSGLR